MDAVHHLNARRLKETSETCNTVGSHRLENPFRSTVEKPSLMSGHARSRPATQRAVLVGILSDFTRAFRVSGMETITMPWDLGR